MPFTKLGQSAWDRNLETFAKLLNEGADVDEKDEYGNLAINLAVAQGQMAMVLKLIENEASFEPGTLLNVAVYHGCLEMTEFLIYKGADQIANEKTGETTLHSAICKMGRPDDTAIVDVLIKAGANPNVKTKPGIDTGAFMRDIRTRAETALHRAAAFGDEQMIQILLDAGADKTIKDINGDSPLTWASWHLRPIDILHLLCYDDFKVRY
ncbi:MAG: ankyrin repeat domain-containing protein [Lentisphaeria bacterium]|nr:ankyrin repeat domain-containing protein [Lentisphaeria bacterium]NQZ68139.1 ankyrin repeat domain-containing protein [Lentisphaeria bacterium]